MRHILKPFAIIYIRYLQWRYKHITEKYRIGQQSTPRTSELILIQAKLYYYKRQFRAWGYFHPDCIWSKSDQKFFDWLFPQKPEEFQEWAIVIWHNPEAITYYHNKIFMLSKNVGVSYESEIKGQLKKWGKWN